MIADESSEPPLHRRQILGTELIGRIRTAAIVGTDSEVKVSAVFVKHQRHPQRYKTGGEPWVEVVRVGEARINAAARV
jgi:hypothetical protein